MNREEAKKILKRIVDTSNELTHPVMLNTEMEAIKVAIEALQAQANLDDVSTAYENGYLQGKFEAQQWIPCSEILPKESGTYFVTAYDGHCKRTSFMKYQKKYQRWDLTGTRTYWKIMAWMPLPSPYKGDKS